MGEYNHVCESPDRDGCYACEVVLIHRITELKARLEAVEKCKKYYGFKNGPYIKAADVLAAIKGE